MGEQAVAGKSNLEKEAIQRARAGDEEGLNSLFTRLQAEGVTQNVFAELLKKSGPTRPSPWNRSATASRPSVRDAPPKDIADAPPLPIDAVEVPEGTPTPASISREGTYRRFLALGDVAASIASFVLALVVLGNDKLGPWLIPAAILIVPVCKLAGLYDRDQHLIHKTTLDEAPMIFSVATLYTLLAFLGGAKFVDGTFGQLQAAFFWALLFMSLLFIRTLMRRAARTIAPAERCVILGNADAAHWLTEKLVRSGAKTVIVGRVALNPGDRTSNELPVLGDFNGLAHLLREHEIDRALIAPARDDDDLRLLGAIRVVKRLGVRVSVLPRLFEVVGSAYELDDVEGATVLGVRRHGLSRSSHLIKRSVDVMASAIGLAMLSPLMVAIAIAIKFDSRGPVFFRQRRVGLNDSVFEIYKFRTMVDGADAQKEELSLRNEAGGGLFKIEDDPRITRVGRFLRHTSLDELPQLLNVLRGEMSLVGPRPLVLDEDSLIEGLHRHRLLLPPGVTGLWQIFGSARIPLNEMVKIDYLYGANWSVWLDAKILLRTIPFVLARRGL